MTTAVVALAGVVVLSGLLVATRARLRHSERRIAALERRVADDVMPAVHAARDDANSATATARRAATVAGADEPPPRLAFEPLAGPVVKTIAYGAGAGRVLSRLVRPRARRAHVDDAVAEGRREARRREAALRAVFAESRKSGGRN
jgi:hypothetical protein